MQEIDKHYDVSNLIARTKLEPRPYQYRLIRKSLSCFLPKELGGKELRAVLIESPTASGKTCTVLAICKAMQELIPRITGEELGICWISHRRNLLGQAERENRDKGINAKIWFVSMFSKELPLDFLAMPRRMVCIDESQHDSCNSSMHIHALANAQYIQGMSVGGDSMVMVRNKDGLVKHIRIDTFIDNIVDTTNDRVMYVDNWEVRAFDGNNFVWKKLKSVIKHKADNKKTYRINTDKGRNILVTEDHSLYRVISNNVARIRDDGSYSSTPKPIAALEEVRGSNLAIGDWLLLEDRLTSSNNVISEVEMISSIDNDGWKIAGDFGDWIEAYITKYNGYYKAHQVRYERRTGKYGPYLTLDEFSSLPLEQQRGTIYFSGNGNKCSTHIPVSALAYLIGFYLGNGWTEGGRLMFSANSRQLPTLRAVLARLHNYAEFTVDEYQKDNSTEVTVYNRILTNWFTRNISGRAWQKKVPDICFNIKLEYIREVLSGMLDTDGHHSFSRQNRNGWHYTTTSYDLAIGLCELLKYVGVIASINKRKFTNKGGKIGNRQIITKHQSYTINFSGHTYEGNNSGVLGRRNHFIMNGIGGYPVRITNIVEEQVEYLYDFSVDDDRWQTFIANSFLVHNSATCYRTDRVKLLFDTILRDSSIGTLIKDNWLAQYEHYTIPNWNIPDVCGFYLREPDRWGKSIIYFHTLTQCYQARDIIRKAGINCDVVTGESDRDQQIVDLHSGKLKVLINCMVLTEGLDLPNLQTAFCKPSCKSLSIQICGRVFRKHQDVPIKNIVQCENTKWPFVRTADPVCAYKWEPAKDGFPGQWLALTPNKNIDLMNIKMLQTLAKLDTKLPAFIEKRRVLRREKKRL